jgi:hypothetical protein
MVGAQHQFLILLQKHGHVRDLELFLDERADLGQQLLNVEHGRGLLGDGVDGLELQSPAALQRMQPRVLNGHGGLGRKQRQQVHGFGVEVIQLVALIVEDADYRISDHQWDGKFGPGIG